MRNLFLLTCLSVLLTFCSKDPLTPSVGTDTIPGAVIPPPVITLPVDTFLTTPIDTPTGTPPGPLLRRITQAGVLQTEFVYNSKWQLVRTVLHNSPVGGITAEKVYRYDYSGMLTRIESRMNFGSSRPMYDTSYSVMYYDANKRVKEIRTYRIKNRVTIFASIIKQDFDAQGRVISEGVYGDSASAQPNHKQTYEYDTRGNIVKVQYTQSNFNQTSTSTTLYEYDQKNNPYRGKWTNPYGSSMNNVVKMISNDGSIQITNFKSYTAQGYPALVNDPNGLDYVYEYY